VSVRIPGEDETGFTPKVTPRIEPAPAAGSIPPASALTPEASKATRKAEDKPAPAPEAPKAAEKAAAVVPSKPSPPAAEPAHAAATAAAEQFVVPVAALASQAKLKELAGKLKAARLPYYTEPLATAKGTVTRVRVGPYATREAAEEAQRQLQRLGLNPGNVVAKS